MTTELVLIQPKGWRLPATRGREAWSEAHARPANKRSTHARYRLDLATRENAAASSAQIVAVVRAERRGPASEESFERLALEAPEELLTWIEDGSLDPTLLTFAAEHAGRIRDSARVVPVLLALLDHPKAYVREGAVYGLAHHLTPEARLRLEQAASTDSSEGVRDAAREQLDAAWSR